MGSTDFAHPVERELARIFDAHGIAWEYEPHTIVSRATLVDSRTLGALLEGTKKLRTTGGQLRVVVGRRDVRRVFEMTLLDRAVSLHPTRAEALASIVAAARPTPVVSGAVPEEAS